MGKLTLYVPVWHPLAAPHPSPCILSRFMYYEVISTLSTARCVLWALINKTTIFQFSCSDCGVCVLLCLHWGTSVPVEQQCSCVYVFLSLPQVVWSELNNQAQLRASSVNSVTMPFMPEICKESKEHTLARSQYASVLHRSALKAHRGVVIKRSNCQCTCKQGFLTGLWRPMIRWVY